MYRLRKNVFFISLFVIGCSPHCFSKNLSNLPCHAEILQWQNISVQKTSPPAQKNNLQFYRFRHGIDESS
jgi:hypothetical protein